MFKKICFFPLVFLFFTFSSQTHALTPNEVSEEAKITQIYVLSLEFNNSSNSANLVASPCYKSESCDTLTAMIGTNTELRNNGKKISFRQARKLNWEVGLLVTDEQNNILILERIPAE